jgi:hypothetical protein
MFLEISFDLEKFFGLSEGSTLIGEKTSVFSSTASVRVELLSNLGALSYFYYPLPFQILSIYKNILPFSFGYLWLFSWLLSDSF